MTKNVLRNYLAGVYDREWFCAQAVKPTNPQPRCAQQCPSCRLWEVYHESGQPATGESK